jgi:hypothetical protein
MQSLFGVALVSSAARAAKDGVTRSFLDATLEVSFN